MVPLMTRSTIEGGRVCNKFVPVSRGNGTKLAPTGYIFDQPPGGMSWIRGKLADHVGGHVVLSPEEGVLVTSAGTESSYPRPPQEGKAIHVCMYVCMHGYHIPGTWYIARVRINRVRLSILLVVS